MSGVRYFGEPWPSALCDEAEQAPTPIGQACYWCDEAIVEGDSGIIDCGNSAAHRNCFLRQSFGSAAHIERRCGCFIPGAEDRDPEGMTRRQAADYAVATWVKHQVAGYVLSEGEGGQPTITCLRCNATSYHKGDIENLYCGRCHKFH